MKKEKKYFRNCNHIFLVMTFNLNMSRTDHNGDTSLLNIKTMAHAASECNDHLYAWFCQKFTSGYACVSGSDDYWCDETR
jgi:hypothetical protein